jgi:hypothetical protein
VLAVVVVAGGGGDEQGSSPAGARLELAAEPAPPEGAAGGGAQDDAAAPQAEAPSAAPRLSAGAGPGSVVYALETARVAEGEDFVVTYDVVGTTLARARLAGRRGELTLEGGPGEMRISTDGIAPGRYRLTLAIGSADPRYERVEIAAGG